MLVKKGFSAEISILSYNLLSSISLQTLGFACIQAQHYSQRELCLLMCAWGSEFCTWS